MKKLLTIKLLHDRLHINVCMLPVLCFLIWITSWKKILIYLFTLFAHEISHGIAASVCGVSIEYLEVLPFGCAAHIGTYELFSGGKEILMAAAGPLINLLLAGIAGGIAPSLPIDMTVLQIFIKANLALALINLIPAYPLDGGRIFQVLLSFVLSQIAAKKITAWAGIVMGTVLSIAGLYSILSGSVNVSSLLVGFFLIVSAVGGLKNAVYEFIRTASHKRKLLHKSGHIDVKQHILSEERRVGDMLKNLDSRKYNLIRVIDQDLHTTLVLDEGDVMRILATYPVNEKIRNINRRKI